MYARYISHQSSGVCKEYSYHLVPLKSTFILSVMIIIPSFGCIHKPPDISDCTRIEVCYKEGALNHFIPSTSGQSTILSEDEGKHVKSFDTWTVTDLQLIKAFAYDVGRGIYHSNVRGSSIPGGVNLVCYRGSEHIASLRGYFASIITADKNLFEYPPGMPDLGILAPPEVKPLEARWKCALNMGNLLLQGFKYRPGRLYPDPNNWCDDIVEFLRTRKTFYTYLKGNPQYLRSDATIARMFACPSLHVSTEVSNARADLAKQKVLVWRSDYAMNSNCRKDSPGDMVFLFEAKAGWNQHGGPELFTFDNHDPKGGCVLLNDGTMKFIRTKEELQQLRWK
jgi:hypothetical protein